MRFWIVIPIALFTAVAAADVVYLRDGTSVTGDVKKVDGGWDVVMKDGKTRHVASSELKSLELSSTTQPTPDMAAGRLASIRRSVENLSDLKQIIARYQTFVKQVAGTPAEAEAKQDLAMWQQRLEEKMTKVGGKWVTAAERAAMTEKSLAAAETVRQLLKQGRLKEAEAAVKEALEIDPQNPSSLYLSGVLAYRQDQLIPARKAFEAVNPLVPNHAPTLNNLAVIAFRQKQYSAAMALYDQAMNASPQNPDVLNNIAEALEMLPEQDKNSSAAQRMLRRFTEQETKFGKGQAEKNMYRWGATWVSKEQLAELKTAEKQVRERLDALAGEFDAIKVSLSNVESEIDENTRAMNNIDRTGYRRGPDGRVYQGTLPPRYYDMQARNVNLTKERTDAYAKLEAIRTAARELKKSYPIPQYTGVQRLIEVEGTPVILPAPDAAPAPAAQPASAPATAPVG